MDEIIRLERVYKTYRTGESFVYALSDVSLTINKGQFVAIMGPSGSGKSTMMNLIGCLDVPTKGKIFLDKQDISKLHESDLAQIRGKKIGFVFQQFNLIKNLTAEENIILPMSFQSISKEKQEKRAEELLKLVELEERRKHYPNQLSGGQQQRIAIARALANEPDLILADEPTGNLDSKSGERIMNFLNKLHENGKTIVLVTHEENLAKQYAEIIYWLKDGKINKVIKNKKIK